MKLIFFFFLYNFEIKNGAFGLGRDIYLSILKYLSSSAARNV
jgi:hypothetical protein